MLDRFIKRNKVRDISFGNIFFKKFVIGLCAFILLTLPILYATSSFVDKYYHEVLDNKMHQLTLDLITIYDSDQEEFVKKDVANYLMAKQTNEIMNNRFTTNAAIAIYNMSTNNIIVRSSECPTLLNSELTNTASVKAMAKDGIKVMSVDQELLNFYKKHKDENVYVKKMYILNDVLFPTQLVTLNEKYQQKDSASIDVPSIIQETTYDEPPVFKLYGNSADDVTLNLISNFNFEQLESSLGEQPTINLTYPSITEKTNLEIRTVEFSIDGVDYRLDCAYRINFWNGALLWVLLSELMGVIAVAGIALWNTKETLDYKH